MDNNYNNDQQNTNSEPYGQENGYSDTPAQEQNNSYPAQNDVQNTYGQNDGNGYGSQNGQYGQQQNGMNYGPQNGQPQGGASYGPQNSPYGQPNNNNNAYGPQNFYQNGNPYGQQGGYPQNPYQQQPPVEGSLGLAIASMVLGISAALFACCFYPISFLLALVGLILGAVAIKKGPAGKGFAITGLVLSVISIALAVIILLFAATLGIGTGLSELF